MTTGRQGGPAVTVEIDQRRYREVLGQYPTGVCVVTSDDAESGQAGLVVGSFTSVSIDPPLVAFFPAKSSSSWPRLQESGQFCVNILSSRQEHLCRQFAISGGDKFAGVRTRPTRSGSLVIEDVVAWIDCRLESVHDAGDHYVVIARVLDLQVESGELPLLFFQGGYGRFAPRSLALSGAGAPRRDLRALDLIRPQIENLAHDLGGRCLVTAIDGDELVVLASAGNPPGRSKATLVGLHLPFVPPNGAALGAWLPEGELNRWLRALPAESDRTLEREKLERVRARGHSLGLISPAQRQFAKTLRQMASDPDSAAPDDLWSLVRNLNYDPSDSTSPGAQAAIRVIAVPVFDHRGYPQFAITLYGFGRPGHHGGIGDYIERVEEAGHRCTDLLDRPRPC